MNEAERARELARARAELEELLSKPIPKKKLPEQPKRDAEVFRMLPGSRWVARPVAASAYVAYEPTWRDRWEETRRAVADAAPEARDQWGLGLWGQETMDDVVKRQNGND
jgi:hypothetical protein